MTVRNPSSRWRDILLGTVCAGFVAGSVGVVWLLGRVNDANDHATTADRHASAASSAAAANQAALHSANACIREACGTPVPTPAPVSPLRGERGLGPTDAQIAIAVTDYCAAHDGCAGVPSQTQVLSAVSAFCSAGACRGANGSSGPPGPGGQPGGQGAQGATGPGPTDDQIAAAVVAYCTAHGDCTGPAGPKGDTGASGRGITSLDCEGVGVDQLTIHYDDGTSQTVSCSPAASTSADNHSGGH